MFTNNLLSNSQKFTKKILSLTIIGATLALATSCAKDLSGSTYVDSANAGVVLEGVVVSARPVKIKSSDKLGAGGSGVGMLGGAAMGGIGGNALGKGVGNSAATVGGVLIGGLLGTLLEDKLGQSDGYEYIVKVSKDNISNDNSSNEKIKVSSNGTSIKNKITNNAKIKTKTEMISVVQGKDQIFNAGQKVYVIYSDDRPRLAPAI